MAFRSLLTQTAIVETLTWTGDAEGNAVLESFPPETHSEPCRLEQTDSIEVLVGETVTISNYRIFLLPDSTIAAETDLKVDGDRYRVVGEPTVMRRPSGPHHIEARLRRVID